MVGNFWVTRREITQNNGRTHPNEYANQISNNHLLSNTCFQTPQNPFTNLHNYNQGRYQNNNIATATTQPMVQFSFSSNNHSSFLTPQARYGRTLPLSSRNNPFIPSYLPNSSQIPSSSIRNTPLIPSSLPNSSQSFPSISRNTYLIPSYPHNASSNGVTTRYRNSSRPILQNQMNCRYSPYSSGSNHTNNINPLVLNDCNPRSRIDLNNNQGNARFDSTMQHHVFNSGETEARREPVSTSVVSCNETQTQKNELLLFKDDRNTVPTRSVIVIDDSSDDEHLDLSLHL